MCGLAAGHRRAFPDPPPDVTRRTRAGARPRPALAAPPPSGWAPRPHHAECRVRLSCGCTNSRGGHFGWSRRSVDWPPDGDRPRARAPTAGRRWHLLRPGRRRCRADAPMTGSAREHARHPLDADVHHLPRRPGVARLGAEAHRHREAEDLLAQPPQVAGTHLVIAVGVGPHGDRAVGIARDLEGDLGEGRLVEPPPTPRAPRDGPRRRARRNRRRRARSGAARTPGCSRARTRAGERRVRDFPQIACGEAVAGMWPGTAGAAGHVT